MDEAMPYEFQEYPAWVSHQDGRTQIVESAEALAALGDGWKMPERVPFTPRENAADFAAYPKWVNGVIVADADAEAALLAQTASPERAVLLQIAAEKGVKVDGRWSDTKLRAAIEAA